MARWTRKEADSCLAAWEKGASYELASQEVGTRSRSAVAGFLHRKKLLRKVPLLAKKRVQFYPNKPFPPRPSRPSRPSRARYSVTPEQAANPKTPAADTATLAPDLNVYSRATFADLRIDGCKYTVDSEGYEHFFCNQPRKGWLPYCDEHCRVVYRPRS